MTHDRHTRSSAPRVILLAAAMLLLTACGGGVEPEQSPSPSTAAPPPPPPPPSATATPTPTPTADPLADWSLEQKVGQLFMVGVDVSDQQQASYDAVRTHHVGNVFLAGRTEAGTERVKNLADSLTDLVSADTTHGVPLFMATDQEGGEVQVLRGPGFSEIPTALEQASVDPETLEGQASTWGAELAAAGVNLDLAPVMDLVPSADEADANAPVGHFDRNYGYTVDDVTSHANAVSAGLESAGVDVAIKHFPGLGRVTENTDTTAGVTDDVTARDDPSVDVFHSGIDAGAAFVMVSTAIYTQIDPDLPAAFSPVVVGDLLRGELGFTGVVITDDVSAAEQVQSWSPADRAVMTIEAGGDMVLVSADPSVLAEMVDAVVAQAQSDADFAARIDASVRRVLTAKERLID